MARPSRKAPRRLLRELDFAQKLDLTAGRKPSTKLRGWGDESAPFRSPEDRAEAWREHADELTHWPRVDHHRAEAWWQYTPGIPDDLRGSDEYDDLARAVEQDDDLNERRWLYLDALNLWVEGEREAVEDHRERQRVMREREARRVAIGRPGPVPGLVPFG